MKRSDIIFTLILPPLDFTMLVLSGMVPYFLRSLPKVQQSGLVSSVFYALPAYDYFFIVCGIAAIWLVFFSMNGLYNLANPRKFFDLSIKIAVSCTTGISAVIIALFLKREFLLSSRFLVLTSWITAIILVILGRFLLRIIRRQLFKKRIGLQNAVIIGTDENTKELAKFLKHEPSWGYRVIAILEHTKSLENKILKLEQSYKTKIDEIIIADLHTSRDERVAILDYCNTHELRFQYAADMFATHVRNIDIDTVAGLPLIEIRRTPLHGWGGVIKRVFDFFAALVGGILLLPFFILIASLIRLDSKGQILVKLKRIGAGGKTFTMYKFRSMMPGAHEKKRELLPYNEREDGPLFKMSHDPRCTSVGKFLRKWSIDEFPQLMNVIKGQMSLVGPRAHEPEEVARYAKHHRKLLYIRPGIVCLAAISGRSGLKFEEEVHLDTYYVENWSFALDINILLKTPFVVLSRKNAV